ncbi:helix-turn-helix domain-containing protein [Shouchella lehensis]|nr:helix-turn-helix domain-containing protein [Shouchella lehensis]MBG9783515.1 DNA-binding protein [Shouchella lehensis]
MNEIVAANIKQLREDKSLSLEMLAKLSGVSKSMLAQIERGEGNPTISTLWKISNGMKVPFDALTIRPIKRFEIVHTTDVQPVLEDDHRVRNYPLFPDNENRKFAIYHLEVQKDGKWESEPHLRGATEFITVYEGHLMIRAGEDEFYLKKGESIRFRADVPHSYRNVGEQPISLHMVIYNP